MDYEKQISILAELFFSTGSEEEISAENLLVWGINQRLITVFEFVRLETAIGTALTRNVTRQGSGGQQ